MGPCLGTVQASSARARRPAHGAVPRRRRAPTRRSAGTTDPASPTTSARPAPTLWGYSRSRFVRGRRWDHRCRRSPASRPFVDRWPHLCARTASAPAKGPGRGTPSGAALAGRRIRGAAARRACCGPASSRGSESMHLGLLERPRTDERGTPVASAAEAPTVRTREELRRRIYGPPAESSAPSGGNSSRPVADLDEHDLVELLARGVGRSITADGLEWLLRLHHPGAAPPAPADESPAPALPRADVADPDGSPVSIRPASRRRPSGAPTRRSARRAAGA